MKKLIEKKCKKCNVEFRTNNGKLKICVECHDVRVNKNCFNCGKEFLARGRLSIHCSRKCITTTRNKKWAIGGKAWQEKWGDLADKKLEEFKLKMSSVTSGERNAMYGKCHTQETKEKINLLNKRSYVEKYGVERASIIIRKLSEALSGEKNPAFGKIYKNTGKSVKGYYKNKFFRSLLEYSFMKHLELMNVNLDDIDYENFLVPWINENGINRTYRPDFYHPSASVVYEVKQSYAVSYNELKHNAARDYFKERKIEFRIVTEKDFEKISFDVAIKDENVKWDERSFLPFNKKSKNTEHHQTGK